uniref:Uncharacterized protein n=1 Tax=Streptomyces ambofaciens (strain ATCC 23877 / 3486 / DSM 40053 / JCM 4204 / NBRC 12836 / NRRL B-2516) TaxID=278992 RepID=A3KJU2_STRA7|nr:hypothetical protein SAML0991 [Streptomyces ambofaciens ATCC 23877]
MSAKSTVTRVSGWRRWNSATTASIAVLSVTLALTDSSTGSSWGSPKGAQPAVVVAERARARVRPSRCEVRVTDGLRAGRRGEEGWSTVAGRRDGVAGRRFVGRPFER